MKHFVALMDPPSMSMSNFDLDPSQVRLLLMHGDSKVASPLTEAFNMIPARTPDTWRLTKLFPGLYYSGRACAREWMLGVSEQFRKNQFKKLTDEMVDALGAKIVVFELDQTTPELELKSVLWFKSVLPVEFTWPGDRRDDKFVVEFEMEKHSADLPERRKTLQLLKDVRHRIQMPKQEAA
jgi:hypothetical protein